MEQFKMEEFLKPIISQVLNMINKKVLLFISGGAVNVKPIFNTLSSYKVVHYDIVRTDSSSNVIGDEYIKELNGNLLDCKDKMVNAIKEADLILVPIMTRNTLSKCALGISDNLVTLGIAESLMMNKEIIAVKDSFNPLNSVNISLGYSKNPIYNNFILEYEKRLTSFGMKFINSEELYETIKEKLNLERNKGDETKLNDCIKQVEINILSGVLTVEDIIKEVDIKSEIHVKEGALMTSLAKDYICKNNIKVKYY